MGVAALLLLVGCNRQSSYLSQEEFDDISSRIDTLRQTWHHSRPSQEEAHQPYEVYLVLDVQKPAIWIEREGRIHPHEMVKLPTGYDWKVSHLTPSGRRDLHGPVRMKQRGDKSKKAIFQECIWVEARKGNAGFRFDLSASGFGAGMPIHDKMSFTFSPQQPETFDTVNESILEPNDR